MNSYKLYYFSADNGEREFVVISDQPKAAIIEEFAGEATLSEVLEIVGDATSLPCDRVLAKE